MNRSNRTTPFRIVLTSVALTVGLGLAGLVWSWARFGLTDDRTALRIEQYVRDTVAAQSAAVESLARRVAAQPALIASATASRDDLALLFDALQAAIGPDGSGNVAVTVYVPGTGSRDYRVLAWSDGPGEQDLSPERLAGPAALFVAPGHAGLRLLAVEPVQLDDRVIAVAVAETVLAPIDRSADAPERRLHTPYGPVTVIEPYASARHAFSAHGFAVTSDRGAPLIEVIFEPDVLAANRAAFLRRVLAVALLPLPVGVSVLGAQWAGRRPRPMTARVRWGRLAIHAAVTTFVAASIALITVLTGLPRSAGAIVLLTGALAIVTRASATLWWQAGRRRVTSGTPARFAIEHLAGGVLLAGTLELVARGLDRWMTLDVLDRGPFVLFPLSAAHTLSAGVVLLAQTVVAWLAASVLAALAMRWRVVRDGRSIVAAVALWLFPTAALRLMPGSLAADAGVIGLAIAAVGVVFALAAGTLHRIYRHTTQSVRLMLAVLAALVPLVALYPLAAFTEARATRHIIETDYAPAVADHPQELRAELRRAQQRVEEMDVLPELVSALPSTDSRPAFLVWSQAGLERSRVVSDVELYGPDRALVSRFAFNLPEYVYRAALRPWQGSNCAWEVFGAVTPFGAEERRMLHAERGICDADGRLLGGVVLRVANNDYQALPFVSSPSPYYELLGTDDVGPRLPGLTLAVYGWSSQPLFTSGPAAAAWPINPDAFQRLYETGDPFWTTLDSGGRTFHVHFSQNRLGVYAIGVPRVTLVEHATRLAEIAALVGLYFVGWQVGLLVHARLARQPGAPLRQVLHEVRRSFYRKLFLSFVVVAVVPVLATAVAFSGYMTARFRADVEREASTTVTVARRVFQELTAGAGERSIELQTAPTDDVMVWIRQVIGQDVNLFDGPEIDVTSQRDLFDSGFLPMRTPASIYRAIALERRPVAVAEDRIGTFGYLLAAAPVSAWGHDAVLTVPLAPRQREIARELDTFHRRVLVGAVLVVLVAAAVGASLASRIADPVARLTRATRQIAAGRLDVRVSTDTADELRRLVDDFNSMAATLGEQRKELARANQLKAWNEMARQVAHEIKNPLTPVQLAAEHLRQVHDDRGRPLGTVLDRCLDTILEQVRLLRQIASEFANFAGEPTRRPVPVDVATLMREIVDPYRIGLGSRVTFDVALPDELPAILADRTLLSRALTNLVENAVQAMPGGGTLRVTGRLADGHVALTLADTGVGMDAVALEHAFEPYFSTKTGGSGLGLANARRNIEREGGRISIASEPGRGTTVTVMLPEASMPPVPSSPPSPSAPA